MRPAAILLFILVNLAFISCQYDGGFSDFVGKEADSIISNSDLRALSIAIIRDGKVYKFHRGNLSDGKPPMDETLYEIASITKTFTGTLLAQAVVEGKVDLEEDIRKYLPENYPNLEFSKKPITFRHLVTHTSGLPHMIPDREEIFEDPDWDQLPFIINELQAGLSRKQFLAELHKVNLDTLPGFKFKYSNAAANLLGYCLERVYDMPYDQMIRKFILEPLHMRDTHLRIADEDQHRLAKGFNANGIEMPPRANKELQAEGGLISNLDDMIKYMQYHLDESHSIVATSHSELFEGRYGDFENGLFWQIFKNGDGPRTIFQNGGAFGTSSWLTLIPETKTGIFIITNASGPEIHQKLSGLADRILAYSD